MSVCLFISFFLFFFVSLSVYLCMFERLPLSRFFFLSLFYGQFVLVYLSPIEDALAKLSSLSVSGSDSSNLKNFSLDLIE